MTQKGFIGFVVKERHNKQLLKIAGLGALLQFVIFKSLYPFPDFLLQSYNYLFSASGNSYTNTGSIVYFKFLVLVHYLTHCDTALVGLQFLLLELSFVFFFFTLLYLYSPNNLTRKITFAFLFFNPLVLYISNSIDNTALFASLSIVWITDILWAIHRPKSYHLLSQITLLIICYSISRNAAYYPIIDIAAFSLSRQSFKWRLASVSLPIILLIIFITHSISGWQLANNALYIRSQASVDKLQLPSKAFRDLDSLSQGFYAKVPGDFEVYLRDYDGNFFLEQPDGPLIQYYNQHYHPLTDKQEVLAWNEASTTFREYGRWLIEHNPTLYWKHFIMPNIKNYLLPLLNDLQAYNLGTSEVGYAAEDWFDYKAPEVNAVSKDLQSYLLSPLPYVFLFMNILCVVGIIWLSTEKRSKLIPRELKAALLLSTIYLTCNFCYSVTAAIVVLRYQFFTMLLFPGILLILLEALNKKSKVTQRVGIQKKKNLLIEEMRKT